MTAPGVCTMIIDSPVGRLSITEAGGAVVRIAWSDHEAGEPQAQPGETPLLARAAQQLSEYFAGTRRDFDLPLDPAGTPF